MRQIASPSDADRGPDTSGPCGRHGERSAPAIGSRAVAAALIYAGRKRPGVAGRPE